MEGLAQLEELEVVSPEDCTIIVGIGLTERDVKAEARIAGTMAHLRRGNPARERSFARDTPHVLGAVADVEAMGARVLASATLGYRPADLDSLCEAVCSSRVLVFVTHHHPELGIQLGPRMVPAREIIDAIGLGFDGVVDLGACGTKSLVEVAIGAGSRATWLGYRDEQRLDFRASVVRAVQRCLYAKQAPYLEILADVIQEFVLQSQELT